MLPVRVPGAADVGTSEEQPRAEARVSLHRNAAADLGLDPGTVASTVRGPVAGESVSQFEDPDVDSYGVRLRVDRTHRTQASDPMGLDLPAQGGRALVPVSQVAHLETGAAPSKIRRRDPLREVRAGAGTGGRSLGEVVRDLKQRADVMNQRGAFASTTRAIPSGWWRASGMPCPYPAWHRLARATGIRLPKTARQARRAAGKLK